MSDIFCCSWRVRKLWRYNASTFKNSNLGFLNTGPLDRWGKIKFYATRLRLVHMNLNWLGILILRDSLKSWGTYTRNIASYLVIHIILTILGTGRLWNQSFWLSLHYLERWANLVKILLLFLSDVLYLLQVWKLQVLHFLISIDVALILMT